MKEADNMIVDKDGLILQTIGKNVKTNRMRLKLTQSEFADKAMIHRNYVCKIENGQVNPSILLLLKIVEVLEIEMNDLLT